MDPKKASDLARSGNLSSAQIRELANSEFPFVREAIASNPSATVEVLHNLVPRRLDSDESFNMALAIARNRDAPGDVLAKVLGLIAPKCVDGSRRENFRFEKIAVVVLAHPAIPEIVAERFLSELSRSKGFKLRLIEADPPGFVLRWLIKDSIQSVRDAALRSLDGKTAA